MVEPVEILRIAEENKPDAFPLAFALHGIKSRGHGRAIGNMPNQIAIVGATGLRFSFGYSGDIAQFVALSSNV